MTRAGFGWCRLADGRALLIPLDSPAAGVGALSLYRPQNLGPRILRSLLGLGLRAGLARHLLRETSAAVERWSAPDGDDATFLLDYLRDACGGADVVFGIHLGAPGPVRKPVVAIMSRRGRALGFAKIGWNAQTVALVENEKASLEALASRSLALGRLPRISHFARWSDRCVLVTDPLPLRDARGWERRLTPLHVEFLSEVAAAARVTGSIGESAFLSRLRERRGRLDGSIPADHARILDAAAGQVASSLDAVDLPWVWRLGDFTPWNLGIESRPPRVSCIDLEYADPRSIPGWDMFHYLRAAVGRGGDRADIASMAWRDGQAYFEALGIDSRLVPALYAAYLIDLYTLWAELWAGYDLPPSPLAADTLARLAGSLEQAARRQRTERARVR